MIDIDSCSGVIIIKLSPPHIPLRLLHELDCHHTIDKWLVNKK